jgi:hypothetical protein
MNKLWIFGDSFSEPYAKKTRIQWQIEYKSFKGRWPVVYGEMVADKLKLKHINLAKGGTDNYTILDSIIDVINTISPDDIIVIGWSNTLRYRVANRYNNFTTILANNLEVEFKLNKKLSLFDLSDFTLTEMAVNRNHPIYINELNNYIKLINFAFPKNKVIHWSPFYLDREGLNTTFLTTNEYQTISEETNGVVDDAHFGENGHITLAKNIINAIDNYETPKFKTNLL